MLLTIVLIIVSVVVVAVGVVLIVAATRPDTFGLSRSAVINAPAGKIFPHINDFHNWAAWSPFEKLDRAMKKTFSGEPSGVGAIYEWQGNSKAGAGRMEITESSSPSKIVIKIDFLKPFENHNIVEFTLASQGESTGVTWSMHGPVPFVAKIFHLLLDMDKLIGKDFAEGLANLKAITEKQPQ